MMHGTAFGAIVPFSGFVTAREKTMDLYTELVRDRFGNTPIDSAPQDIAHRFARQTALALERKDAAVTFLELGLDVDWVKRHG